MKLPSIDAIAGRAKHRKSDWEALLNAYETLASIDVVTSPNQLVIAPREAKDCWLVAKYGLEAITEA